MEKENEVKQEKKKKGKAKKTSLFAQIFAAIWMISLTLCKGFNLISLEVSEIIYSGIGIAGIFMPVYFSIWMEKIKDIKLAPGQV